MNVQQRLEAVEQMLKQILEQLDLASEENMEIQKLLAEFVKVSNERDKLMKTILKLHEAEMKFNEDTPTTSSPKQKEQVACELKLLEKLCDMGLRSEGAVQAPDLLTDPLFSKFGIKLKDNCPLLQSIVESLVISNQRKECQQNKQQENTLWVSCISSSLECTEFKMS